MVESSFTPCLRHLLLYSKFHRCSSNRPITLSVIYTNQTHLVPKLFIENIPEIFEGGSSHRTLKLIFEICTQMELKPKCQETNSMKSTTYFFSTQIAKVRKVLNKKVRTFYWCWGQNCTGYILNKSGCITFISLKKFTVSFHFDGANLELQM